MSETDRLSLAESKNTDRLLWEPTPETIANSNMTRYANWLTKRVSVQISEYSDLYDWSVSHVDLFWESIWDYSEIKHSILYSSVLTGKSMLNSYWFEGARLNFAENLLRFRDDRIAICFLDETGKTESITYNELYRQVAKVAQWMRELGITVGDRVAGFLPNRPETVVAMLATTSVGAIWSSCSPDFGHAGLLDRFAQINPKLLFTVEETNYNGKQIDLTARVQEIVGELPSVLKTVILPTNKQTKLIDAEKFISYNDLLTNQADTIEFEQLPFDHPVYIMFSSGTTGAPKGIVHGAGGTLLQHFKEHALHTNLTRDDKLFYFTTCGWMMWNWLVSALQIGVTICLYDGSAFYPDNEILWRWVADQKITVFGTSPKYLATCQERGLKPNKTHELSSLKTILSTGAPLTVANFDYVYNDVKSDVRLSSISGGTDIISCFLLGNPNLPVYSGELQCRGLGMRVEVFNDQGEAVVDEVGELVATSPFPSMPVSFWDDPDQNKYIAAYFNHYPGLWRHGDYIKLTKAGGLVVYGRSDATLNPGGVRIGTSEIYEPVESMSEIIDSVVVGQQHNNDVRVVLFVVLKAGLLLTEELTKKIKQRIRAQSTARHIPAIILAIDEVPRTINGKKVELAVANMIHGRTITNASALANPDALRQFDKLPQLKQ